MFEVKDKRPCAPACLKIVAAGGRGRAVRGRHRHVRVREWEADHILSQRAGLPKLDSAGWEVPYGNLQASSRRRRPETHQYEAARSNEPPPWHDDSPF